MSREFWEKVDTRTLNPGDVVVNYAGENAVWDAGDLQIVNDNPAGPWHIPCLFRRYTGHHPDVLMRVIKLMMAYIDEENLQNVSIEEWTRQAEAEIAKEREA
jgi:hypothetical protein